MGKQNSVSSLIKDGGLFFFSPRSWPRCRILHVLRRQPGARASTAFAFGSGPTSPHPHHALWLALLEKGAMIEAWKALLAATTM